MDIKVARAIRRRWKAGGVTMTQIGKEFSYSQVTIWQTVHGGGWSVCLRCGKRYEKSVGNSSYCSKRCHDSRVTVACDGCGVVSRVVHSQVGELCAQCREVRRQQRNKRREENEWLRKSRVLLRAAKKLLRDPSQSPDEASAQAATSPR